MEREKSMEGHLGLMWSKDGWNFIMYGKVDKVTQWTGLWRCE